MWGGSESGGEKLKRKSKSCGEVFGLDSMFLKGHWYHFDVADIAVVVSSVLPLHSIPSRCGVRGLYLKGRKQIPKVMADELSKPFRDSWCGGSEAAHP